MSKKPHFADSCDQTEEEEVPDGEGNYITGKQLQMQIQFM